MSTLETASTMPSQSSQTARRAMIDSQLRTSGVNAPFAIARMSAVPREDFVPATSKGFAYMDRAIRLENGQALPAPVVQGLMLQEAAPAGTERALLVDCGAGYLAELLRPLVASLTVISAEEALLTGSPAPQADLLLVEGAAQQLPQPLLDRLAEGARIVTGVFDDGVTRLAVGRKSDSGAALLPLADIGMPRIPAFDKPQAWSF